MLAFLKKVLPLPLYLLINLNIIKSMKRVQLFLVALATVAFTTLAACGGEQATENTEETTEEVVEETTEVTEETTTEVASETTEEVTDTTGTTEEVKEEEAK